jgi:hypothetical protein
MAKKEGRPTQRGWITLGPKAAAMKLDDLRTKAPFEANSRMASHALKVVNASDIRPLRSTSGLAAVAKRQRTEYN